MIVKGRIIAKCCYECSWVRVYSYDKPTCKFFHTDPRKVHNCSIKGENGLKFIVRGEEKKP